MTNKIDGPGSGLPPLNPARSDNASGPRPSERPESRRPDAGDSARVEVTDQALGMKRLEDRILDMPAVDKARVDAVRERLAAGDYEIDSDRVADKLIRYEQELD